MILCYILIKQKVNNKVQIIKKSLKHLKHLKQKTKYNQTSPQDVDKVKHKHLRDAVQDDIRANLCWYDNLLTIQLDNKYVHENDKNYYTTIFSALANAKFNSLIKLN